MVAKSTLSILLAILCPLLTVGCGAPLVFTPPQTPVNIIYDDDCDGDVDCAVTQPIIHYWIDKGYVKLWGMVSSGHSSLGAPTMKVFSHYYDHDSLFLIGAWTLACGLHESSAWNVAVVNEFDAGDICTNYVDCGIVLRQSVANYIASGGRENGLKYVITGPLSCEEEFRATLADSISPLTGIQMERQFINEFVLMNGCTASPTAFPCTIETNCADDASACSTFFANVTSQNGYPPVFVVPLNTGAAEVFTRVPIGSLPSSNPTAYAFNSIGRSDSADEDALTVEYAVFGSLGWVPSLNSTNTTNASTSANSWNSNTASGQYYLSTAIGSGGFESVLANPWVPE
jgi:hypothetical protein